MKAYLFRSHALSRSIMYGVVVIILSLAAATSACQFEAAIGSSRIGLCTTWDNDRTWLPDHSDDNYSNDGFGIAWWVPPAPMTVNIFRSPLSIYSPTGRTLYLGVRDNQVDPSEARVYMAHSRAVSGTPNIDDPHPFIYPKLFNYTWALQHNGKILETFMPTVEDNFGAGFAVLDQFVDRTHARWRIPAPTYVVDTEYYTAWMMKYLLISENYYWTDANLGTNVEFAVQKTLDKIWQNSSENCLNATFGCDTALWLIRKRHPNDHPLDPQYHQVSYWYPQGTDDGYRLASTTNRGTVDGWHHLSDDGFVCLTPNIPNPTPESIVAPVADANILELRVNDRNHSAGNQSQPAISADPVRGTFVAVWATSDGSRIKGRWYNQMGLAEGEEFFADNGDATGNKRSPAICHAIEGDRFYVVWSERPSTHRDYIYIRMQEFIWNAATRKFDLGATYLPLNSNQTTAVDHPAVACKSNYGIAVTWQQRTATGYDVHVYTNYWQSAPADRIISSGNLSNTEPDIANFYGDMFVVVFESQGVSGSLRKAVIRPNSGNPVTSENLVNLTTANATLANPAIAAVSNYFGVAYINPSNTRIALKRQIYDPGSGIWGDYAVQISSVTCTQNTLVDIAPRTSGQGWDICFQMTGDGDDIAMINYYTSWSAAATVNDAAHFDGNQCAPAMAISPILPCNAGGNYPVDYYYRTTTPYLSDNKTFNQRRMVIYTSTDVNQDGNGTGIVGRFQGLTSTGTNDWYAADPIYGQPTLLASEDNGKENDKDIHGIGSLDELLIPTETATPAEFELHAAFPNPFNPATTIRFDLPEACLVRLDVFDVNGRRAATLTNSELAAGTHSVWFDGTALPSGTYFARLQAGTYSNMTKLLLLK